jgi:hypothetical protein
MQTNEQRAWYKGQRAYTEDDFDTVGNLVLNMDLSNFRLLETAPSMCANSKGSDETASNGGAAGGAGGSKDGEGGKGTKKETEQDSGKEEREQEVQNMVSALMTAHSSCSVMMLVQDYMTICPRSLPVLYHAVEKARGFDSDQADVGSMAQNNSWLAIRMSNEVSGTVIQCKDAPALAKGVMELALGKEGLGLDEAVDTWLETVSASTHRGVLHFASQMVRPLNSVGSGNRQEYCSQPVAIKHGKGKSCETDDIDPCPPPPMKWEHDDR